MVEWEYGMPHEDDYASELIESMKGALTVGVGSGESPLNVQVGGDHYKSKAIQPVQYCMANGIGFMEGSVIKYVSRWRDKGGVQDLQKARHFLDMLIEYEKKEKGA